MTVIIGNARISENGTISGNKGDQTGCEVMTQTWSSGGTWTHVFRPNSIETANKIAKAMKLACENNNIGYNQYDRTSLYAELVKNGYKMSKVGKCNTDCSALVACCLNYAGILVSKDMYTGNEKAIIEGTGKFKTYTGHAYTRSESMLATGDILLRNGHTAIVVQGAVTRKPDPFKVEIIKNVVIRAKSRKLSKRNGLLKKGKKVTIVETAKNGTWGKLKSGDGWIALPTYTKKVK